MMVDHWFWCAVGVISVVAVVVILRILFSLVTGYFRRRREKQWNHRTQNSDNLILHCPAPSKVIPSASPFVMKVMAYLRMTGIPYELDHTTPFGGTGKTPWITIGGKSVSDSELITKYLMRRYKRALKGPYTEEQLAVATSIRIMLEEHLYWGVILERFVYGNPKDTTQVVSLSPIARFAIKRLLKSRSQAQAIGTHSHTDIIEIMSNDLRAVSQVLGDKKFILGDEPCFEDAAIFGQLSQCCWGVPNSPYETLVNGECKNLKEYCVRIRATYFPDWK